MPLDTDVRTSRLMKARENAQRADEVLMADKISKVTHVSRFDDVADASHDICEHVREFDGQRAAASPCVCHGRN